MNGENGLYCNTCKAIYDCVVWINLITDPEILFKIKISFLIVGVYLKLVNMFPARPENNIRY